MFFRGVKEVPSKLCSLLGWKRFGKSNKPIAIVGGGSCCMGTEKLVAGIMLQQELKGSWENPILLLLF